MSEGTRTADEVRNALREWATHSRAERDKLIREADAADISKRQIAQLMGISRTTVYTVLGGES